MADKIFESVAKLEVPKSMIVTVGGTGSVVTDTKQTKKGHSFPNRQLLRVSKRIHK